LNYKKIILGSFIVVALGIGLGLAACGKKDPSAHALYKCEGGVTLDVVFTGGQEVQIGVRDKAYKLDRVEYESGAKYEGGPISFISMGVSAKFTEKGHSIQCRRD
jgi:membrane-bound inhibitor of C-type lysozyme